jgi:hypothetical protein
MTRGGEDGLPKSMPSRPPAPRRLIAATALLCPLLSLLGCGAEGEPAPEPPRSAATCLTLEARLQKTRAALAAGAAEGLKAAIEAATARRDGDDVRALLDAGIALLGELWRQLQDERRALPITAINDALASAKPQLIAALRYLAQPGPTQAATYDLLGGLLSDCPSRSVTDALTTVLADPDLIAALGASFSDPTVQSVIAALPPNDGLAPLVRAIIRALNSPNFVFDDLIALIDPLFDLDQPPLDALLPPLRRLMSGDNLTTIRALTVCLEDAIVTRDGQRGSEALGALLYGLLQAPGVDLGALLLSLDPALNLIQDPNTIGLLDAMLTLLQRDDRTRDGLKPALLTLISPALAPGVLTSLANLIDADALPELLSALSDFLNPACHR